MGGNTEAFSRLLTVRATPKTPSDDEDNGWGEENKMKEEIIEKETNKDFLLSDLSPPSTNLGKAKQEPERDLFIPIFTLVSLTGFFGAYAYETFRLYANGELYLPGMN